MFEKLEIWERGKDKTTIYVIFRQLEVDFNNVKEATGSRYIFGAATAAWEP